MPRSRIFISYRREDGQQAAGRLAADLRAHFGRDQVFEDIASIAPGADFMDALREGLANCGAVIVVIGPRWAMLTDRHGKRRIDAPDDWVRQEVAYGLRQDLRVFPVLVDDASMPRSEDLPEDLRSLTRRQAMPITVRHWAKDVGLLVEHLKLIRSMGAMSAQQMSSMAAENELVSEKTLGRKEPTSFDEPHKKRIPQVISSMKYWHWGKIVGISVVLFALSRAFSNGDEADTAQTPKLVVAPLPSSASKTNAKQPPALGNGEPDSDLTHKAAGATSSPTLAASPLQKADSANSFTPFALGNKDCDVCPEMVVIRPGGFLMGSPPGERYRRESEGPQHKVNIAAPFAVGKFEVTFDEWDICLRNGGCNHNPLDHGWGRGRRPVIDVSLRDAEQYVRWLSAKTGKSYRLLTEAEWEFVARAGTNTPFSFGLEIDPMQANYTSPGVKAHGQPVVVGSYPANAFTVHDMHGNVWEWTSDCWKERFDRAPYSQLEDPGGPRAGPCLGRVVRGGGWNSGPGSVRSATRIWFTSDYRSSILGFRVARTL